MACWVHDRCYAINPAKAQAALSWRPQTDFAAGLTDLISWYTAHRPWWERVKSGEYREYAEKWYPGLSGQAALRTIGTSA